MNKIINWYKDGYCTSPFKEDYCFCVGFEKDGLFLQPCLYYLEGECIRDQDDLEERE